MRCSLTTRTCPPPPPASTNRLLLLKRNKLPPPALLQSDYDDIPIPGVSLEDLKQFNDQIEEPLADPSTALTLNELLAAQARR